MDLLKHIYPPAGPFNQLGEDARKRAAAASEGRGMLKEIMLDDTDRPPAEVLSRLQPRGQCRQSKEKKWTIAALGYHTTLVLELVSFWTEFLGDEMKLEVAAHILEPEAGTPEEVRKQSLCR